MKTYKIYKTEKESTTDKKAYSFLEKLISGGYESDDSRIIVDQNGDCHQCDLSLAKMSNLMERNDRAMYAIMINDDKIKLLQLF